MLKAAPVDYGSSIFKLSPANLEKFRLRNAVSVYTRFTRKDNMAGRKGIKDEDVIRAYIALLQQRRIPGPVNLRLELGTGSYTTILQSLRKLALRHPKFRPPVNMRKNFISGASEDTGS